MERNVVPRVACFQSTRELGYNPTKRANVDGCQSRRANICLPPVTKNHKYSRVLRVKEVREG